MADKFARCHEHDEWQPCRYCATRLHAAAAEACRSYDPTDLPMAVNAEPVVPQALQLIGLHGLPRSGKDTIADVLARHNFRRFSFAAPLKEAAALLLSRPVDHAQGVGYDREQVMPEWGFSMRWFLQKFGTECLRDQIREDFWIQRARVSLDAETNQHAVFTDVRFPNEAAFILERGGLLVEVTRPGVKASGHASDQHIRCQLTIQNTGTIEDLVSSVDNLVKYLRI